MNYEEMESIFREMESQINFYHVNRQGHRVDEAVDFLLDCGIQIGYNKYMDRYFIDIGNSPIANDFYDNRANEEDMCFVPEKKWNPKRKD